MSKIPRPRFNLKNPDSQTESLIYLIYRYRGIKVKYSTQTTIKVKEWDFKTQRPIEKERRPDLWAMRMELDDLAAMAKAIYIERGYGDLSADEFKTELEKRMKGRVAEPHPESPSISFFEFVDLELADMEAANMKKGSLKMYKLHSDILKEFAKRKGRFSFQDVDWTLRLQLIDWLASKNVQLAYGNKTLSVLRQFMERARRKGYHDHTTYQGQGWTVKALKAEGTKVTLTQDELSRLAEMNLKGYLKKARDLFLVGVGTGQRFSDFSQLTPDHFYRTMNGVPLLSIISQKTATPAKIPINIFSWLLPILEAYEYRSPKLSMQKLNSGLKEICKMAGIEEKVLVVEQYIGRKPKIKKRFVPKYEMISSHTCRRTFSTNLYRMGYSLSQIMLMTGHATEAQLRLYIGIDAEENAEAIALAIAAKQPSNSFNTSKTLQNVSL